MKTKLTLLLFCFCSSIFSETYVLTSEKIDEKVLIPGFTITLERITPKNFKCKFKNHLNSEEHFKEYELLEEDEGSLTLISNEKNLKTIIVIHKKNEVFSRVLLNINHDGEYDENTLILHNMYPERKYITHFERGDMFTSYGTVTIVE
jgi:hypothetical protein